MSEPGTFEAFEETLRALVQDDETAVDAYRALCNVVWVPVDSPWRAADELPLWDEPGADEVVAVSWRYAGGWVARLRNRGEGYLDFYCSGGEGTVTPGVREAFLGAGYRPVRYEG